MFREPRTLKVSLKKNVFTSTTRPATRSRDVSVVTRDLCIDARDAETLHVLPTLDPAREYFSMNIQFHDPIYGFVSRNRAR